jgi:predicted site-specific integrase-resolvase
MNGTWLRSTDAGKHFGVHPSTMRRWADNGFIEYKRTPGNQRVYNIHSTDIEHNKPIDHKISYIYTRVSSSKQKDDLNRQCEFLQNKYPNFTVIKDIGSGLNFKRRGLLKLLESVNKGLVKEIVVASKDRLCRFGFDLLKWQFEQNNVKLVVLDTIDKSPEEEFTEDILAILQVFACRWNGKRKYSIQNKKNQIEIDINSNKTTRNVETCM